jgi:3,4-dihydroxy 2-butanone 4-phosphate synthase/GTP cyclohydrolase II
MRAVQSLNVPPEPEHVAKSQRGMDFRTFGIGAQIVRALGVRRMRVVGAPKQMHALSGFGLEVVEYVSDAAEREDSHG